MVLKESKSYLLFLRCLQIYFSAFPSMKATGLTLQNILKLLISLETWYHRRRMGIPIPDHAKLSSAETAESVSIFISDAFC